MFFGAQHGLVGVIDDQVRVEHMFFGAQHGLDGVKSVLSICFFCAEHGLHNCESHPKRITFAQHGLSKSVLSMFTGWFIVNQLNTDLLSPCCANVFWNLWDLRSRCARVAPLRRCCAPLALFEPFSAPPAARRWFGRALAYDRRVGDSCHESLQ